MKIFPLGSSSKGNSTYIESDESAILIDAGFGVRKTGQLLSEAGFSLEKVSAIFITHEHCDHISGLLSLTKRLNNVPVYGSSETLSKVKAMGKVSSFSRLIEIDASLVVNFADMEIKAFKVSHDSACCLAFCVCCGRKKFSICTDLGEITSAVLNNLDGSDFVMLEANFDVGMLNSGKYPYALKKRIASKYGHLSNSDAARLVCWLINRGVRRFLLSHLSENNNFPSLAFETVELALNEFDFKVSVDYFLDVAPVKSVGKIFEV